MDASVMVILEAPGWQEVKSGRPAVGPAGKILNECLVAAGMQRVDVRVENTVGCVDMDREDRRPLPAGIQACRPRLMGDIEEIQPRVIVCCGGVAISTFFPGFTVSKVRGMVRAWKGVPVVATYHPAYALPFRSPQVKPLIIEDLKKARELGG